MWGLVLPRSLWHMDIEGIDSSLVSTLTGNPISWSANRFCVHVMIYKRTTKGPSWWNNFQWLKDCFKGGGLCVQSRTHSMSHWNSSFFVLISSVTVEKKDEHMFSTLIISDFLCTSERTFNQSFSWGHTETRVWSFNVLCVQVTGRKNTRTAGGAGSATSRKWCASWEAVTTMMPRMQKNVIPTDLSRTLFTNETTLCRPLCSLVGRR